MKIQCLKGYTVQSIGGATYPFERDREGRFVCDVVNRDHQSLFLARPKIYQPADALPAPKPPPVREPAPEPEPDEPDLDEDDEDEDDVPGIVLDPALATEIAGEATELAPHEPTADAVAEPAAEVGPTEPETPKAPSWDDLTVPQLTSFAKDHDVRLGQATRKADIIALLEAAGKTPPAKE